MSSTRPHPIRDIPTPTHRINAVQNLYDLNATDNPTFKITADPKTEGKFILTITVGILASAIPATENPTTNPPSPSTIESCRDFAINYGYQPSTMSLIPVELDAANDQDGSTSLILSAPLPFKVPGTAGGIGVERHH